MAGNCAHGWWRRNRSSRVRSGIQGPEVGGDGLCDLFTGCEGQVGGPHDKSIGGMDPRISDEPLEVPSGIAIAAAAGRLGKPDVVPGPEYLREGHAPADTEVERLRVEVVRGMVDEGEREVPVDGGKRRGK